MSHYQDFDTFARWYIARRQRTFGRVPSPHTVKSKQVHLASFSRIAGVQGEQSLATLLSRRSAVEDLLDEVSLRMSPGAMRVGVYALLDFSVYAIARDLAEETSLLRTDVPGKNPPKPITVYTKAEMELFVSAAKGVELRWWALMCFLADTGRRVGEALELRWDWLKLDSAPPYFELPYQKNGNPQYIPLGRRLREEVFTPPNIAKLKHGRASLRRDPADHPFPWKYGTIHSRFERFCETTGLPNRGFHNLRHTVITDRLVRGVPLQAVSALAGHANPGVTQTRYHHAHALDYARYLDEE